MAFQNAIIEGLQAQGQATSYYFEAYRDIRVMGDNPPSGLTYVTSFQLRDNYQDNYTSATWVLGNSQWGIRINPGSYWWIEFWQNGSMITDFGVVRQSGSSYYSQEFTHISLMFGIDETNNKGTILILSKEYQTYSHESYYWMSYYKSELLNNATAYNWIINHIVLPYNWQSVPSISGKNGILSLVTLDSESINDGEPVSGAAVSVFDQAPSNDNNIKNLADTYGGGEESSAVDVTVKYKVTLPPGGSFSVLKLVAKKDSIPEDASDGDKIADISPSKTKKTVTGLDENSMYYFKIFAEDTNSNTSESDEKHITTSGDEGWTFDYTGEIQTFVAPKTGIYQLETWGAQGGDATDGTNSARGGYGAYAVGEVLLQQGETLYINVGGQNGYGGGGLNLKGTRQLTKVKIDGNDVNLLTVTDKSVYTQSATWGQQIYASNSVPNWLNAGGNDFYTITEPYLSDSEAITVDKYMSGTTVSARRRSNVTSLHKNAIFLAVNNTEINGYIDTQDVRQLWFGLLADDDTQKVYFLLVLYNPSPASGEYKYTAWLHNSDASVCSALYDALKYLPDYQ